MHIQHDIHTHNLFSACCHDLKATIPAYLDTAEELGHKIFGISNHIWDERVPGCSSWYRHQTIAHSEEAKYGIRERSGMKILFGAETEYAAMSDRLGMSVEGANHFDYLLVPHSHNHMRGFVMPELPDITKARENLAKQVLSALPGLGAETAQKMANAVSGDALLPYMGERTDFHAYLVEDMLNSFDALFHNTEFLKIIRILPVSIAHPFAPCGAPMAERRAVLNLLLQQSDRISELVRTAASLGVGMEVNCGAIYEAGPDFTDDHPAVRLFRLMKDAGCKFTFGTDSHSVQALSTIRRGDIFSEQVGITEDDLMEFLK